VLSGKLGGAEVPDKPSLACSCHRGRASINFSFGKFGFSASIFIGLDEMKLDEFARKRAQKLFQVGRRMMEIARRKIVKR